MSHARRKAGKVTFTGGRQPGLGKVELGGRMRKRQTEDLPWWDRPSVTGSDGRDGHLDLPQISELRVLPGCAEM